MRLVALSTLALSFLIALGVHAAGAQDAETPEPTATARPDEGILVVHVVNDLNENGRRDPGEPGLEGWRAHLGCGDALLLLDPTNDSGRTSRYLTFPNECVGLEVHFGWFATNDRFQEVNVRPGTTVEVTFLVRFVGDQVAHAAGFVIENGLPAPVDARVDALVAGRGCADAEVFPTGIGGTTLYEMYVFGRDERSGCARPGAEVSFTVNGAAAGSARFTPGRFTSLDLIAGPAPMYSYLSAPEGTVPEPFVSDTACGRAFGPGTGFTPPNWFLFFVLPDEVRLGCGAPGRIVEIRARGDVILYLEWQPGFVAPSALTGVTPPPPILPDTGVGAPDGSSALPWLLAASLAASGLLLASALLVRIVPRRRAR